MADTSLSSFEIATLAAETRANLILLEEYCQYRPDVEEAHVKVCDSLSGLIGFHLEELMAGRNRTQEPG